MIVVMNGREIQLISIDNKIDGWFINFYKAYFDNETINLDEFNNQALNFFDTHKDNYKSHDDFFTNFTILWRSYISNRDYGTAELVWERNIELAHMWELKMTSKRIHKGTPYYFWGMTAILRGDIDKGYALMHKALQEDIDTQKTNFPDSPSFSFVIADYADKKQAFGDWPRKLAGYIQKKILTYNNQFTKKFSLEEFWGKIVNSNLEKSVIYQFALYISKLYNRERKPQYIYEGEFASQLLLDYLFNISLVIDSIIKVINPNQYKFRDHVLFANRKIALNFTDENITEINRAFNNNFNLMLENLLDRKFKISGEDFLSDTSTAYAITYGIRNHGAHNVTSAPVIWQRFKEIEVYVLSMMFNVIENLY